ncbi:MAG: signal recognition particle protein [Spirochaetes bacterium]|nr:signal recognition particle protein [Spirochaetota bacterium]MBU0956379.1 signal recognition particle protein [Spirochaetota bacterium]
MLEKLSRTFTDIFKTVSGKASITEKNIDDAVEQIKMALLEADVNLRVVRRFVNATIEEAKGEKVLRSVQPGQQFVKIVHDRMVALLGDSKQDLQLKGPDTLSVILMAGLQGSGKTTSTAKLGYHLKAKGRKVMLVACDLVRPAAVQQLILLGEQVGVTVYHENNTDPLRIAKNALSLAKKELYDTIVFDTTGRMQIDDSMMGELEQLRNLVRPDETLLVADAMTGQAAVDIAKVFNERIGISGVILTKFDSDTRGGAALSLKSVTDRPIKFIGVSEKPDGLEVFHPERIASRILGMGDIVSLVEKAQEVIDEEESVELEKKLANQTFTLQDYLDQLRRMKKMGSMKNLLEMMPGLAGQVSEEQLDSVDTKHEEAIILSMTKKERVNYLIIGPTRRSRIARGSGTSVAEVSRLLKKFEKSCLMMKKAVKNKKMAAKMMGGAF